MEREERLSGSGERAELERRVREFAAGLEKHAAEIISGDHEESDREVATTYRVVAYDLKALLSQEQPAEVFASRSQEKRIRTMRGDPDPLTLREAQPAQREKYHQDVLKGQESVLLHVESKLACYPHCPIYQRLMKAGFTFGEAQPEADAPISIRANVLREAADSIRRRAACWAGEGQAGATQASIDIRAELLNEALTVEKLTPELSDKNGWVYDPDAKLAEIRAGMAAPEPDKTCSVCGNEEVHHRTGMLTCECPALKRFSDETDRLRAGASQPPAETKMEPEPRPSFHRYVGREDLCKACKEPFDTGNHFDDRRGERRRQPPAPTEGK